jgi:TatD DNase family protein
MTVPLVDTHAHLDMEPFETDTIDVIERARVAGVTQIITVGIDLESSRAALRLAEAHSMIWAAVGWHPQEADSYQAGAMAELKDMVTHPKVVALGEMGLDFHHGDTTREAQLCALRGQLVLARETGLPVILHCRQAESELLALLRESAPESSPRYRGVVHCFSGNTALAEQYLELGFHISLGAYIGYPSSRHLQTMLRALPEDCLLLETDCPFLPPQNRRGQRNEPAYLGATAAVLASMRGVPLEDLARSILHNTRELFHMSDEKDQGFS